VRPQLPALSRRFTLSSRRPVRSRIIQALLVLVFARPRSRKIESLIRTNRCHGSMGFRSSKPINPPAVSSTRISYRCPLETAVLIDFVIARRSLRRTGIRHQAGLGNAGRLSVASPDSDSSFWQSERQRCGAFRGMLRRARDEGSVTQCRRPRR